MKPTTTWSDISPTPAQASPSKRWRWRLPAPTKGTYDGPVIPRKLPGPDDTLLDAKPIYDAAVKTARPALQALYSKIFADNRLDAIAFPTTPALRSPPIPSPARSRISLCSSRTPTPAATRASPESRSRSRSAPPANCRSDSNSTAPPAGDRRLLAIGIALDDVFGRLPAPTR